MLAAWPLVSVPTVVAPAQLRVVSVAAGAATFTVKLQLCPPKLIAKVAVPLVDAVPVMVYVTLPFPLAKVPALKVAVSPVTPVEARFCALYVPAFPPVYGTLTLTLPAAWPLVSTPTVAAFAQSKVVRAAAGGVHHRLPIERKAEA